MSAEGDILQASEAATWALFGLFVHFMEKKGAVDRAELIGYLRGAVDHWGLTAGDKMTATSFQLLRSKIATLDRSGSREPPVSLQ